MCQYCLHVHDLHAIDVLCKLVINLKHSPNVDLLRMNIACSITQYHCTCNWRLQLATYIRIGMNAWFIVWN